MSQHSNCMYIAVPAVHSSYVSVTLRIHVEYCCGKYYYMFERHLSCNRCPLCYGLVEDTIKAGLMVYQPEAGAGGGRAGNPRRR